jgi:CubicO group peptidase (beta-lactamase class C family)
MTNHFIKKALLFIAFLVGFSNTSFSQKINTKKIDQLISRIHKKNTPGVSVLISKKGKVIYHKQFGLANLEFDMPINATTKFSIGSITKQFTAAAILLLEEQGKLKTSDYISKYLPDFDKEKYPIKIEHLLSHTSGIASDNSKKEIREGLRRNITPLEIMTILKDIPLLFDPGTKYDYSNGGYILLGIIIERISEISYEEFLNQNIFKPTKMNNSLTGSYQNIVKKRASGYDDDGSAKTINATYHASSFSAGAIISTPTDLNKWAVALFSEKIINRKSLSKMLQNYKLESGEKINNGFGWELNSIQSSISYEHTGFEPGYKSSSIYLPKEQIYVIVMQNTEVNSPTYISLNVASIVLENAYPNILEEKVLSKEKLEKFTGTYRVNETTERIVGLDKNNKLYYKSPGGSKQPLFVLNENLLFFKEGYRQLSFNDNYTEILYKNRGFEATLKKKSNEVPKEDVAIFVDAESLKKYVGVYKTPQFKIVISLENNQLYAQPEGSDKELLLAKGNHKFFIKAVGGELEFSYDSTNTIIQHVNILFGGDVFKGIRE